MANDSTAPATKDDIRLLKTEIGKLYAANEQWKDELKEHFDVVAENIKHDFQEAVWDKLAQHEDRIVRLEREAGLRAA